MSKNMPHKWIKETGCDLTIQQCRVQEKKVTWDNKEDRQVIMTKSTIYNEELTLI